MKNIVNSLWWAILWILVSIISGASAFFIGAIDIEKYAGAFVISSIISLISGALVFDSIKKIREKLVNINKADEIIDENPLMFFYTLSRLHDSFKEIFTLLKDIPSEKILKLQQIGNICQEEHLRNIILWCVNDEPDLLSDDELDILRNCFVQRFPFRTEQLLDSFPVINLTDAEMYTELTNKISDYYKVTGKFAKTTDLAYGLIRALSIKNISAKERITFTVELDKYLFGLTNVEEKNTTALHKELVRQYEKF